MPQQTFADMSFKQYRKPTCRERFLDEMDRVVPWADLVAAIEPVYPKAEGPGRPPVGIEHMLRHHCQQQWFNLSDPAVEEALYDSHAMRQFLGIDLGRELHPGQRTSSSASEREKGERARNRAKSKARAKVEHVFLVMNQTFGWAKVRYWGLAKNTNWLFVTCGLTDLYLTRGHLLAGTRGRVSPGRRCAVGREGSSRTGFRRASGYSRDSSG